MKAMKDWTPAEHIEAACVALEKVGTGYSARATGNAPVGVHVANAHAAIAQAKMIGRQRA